VTRPFGRLHDLLDEERQALLAADFGRLPALAAEKERLARAVASTRPEVMETPLLSTALSRNAALISAALAGLREAVTGRDDRFRIYSAAGQARTAGEGRPLRLTRRA
jgi:hypothetical protein